jgi:hypothetical protein
MRGQMYKAYLAGLSGEHLQFTNLSEAEAAAFALGVLDKGGDCCHPRRKGHLEEAVTQLVDGEWTTTLTAMQASLNQMQAERDELRGRCDELMETLRERDDLFVPNPEHPVHE